MSDEWRERAIALSKPSKKKGPAAKAPEPPWREKARRMHAEGRYTYRQIGEACGVHLKTVERFISMDRGFTSTGRQSSITEEALTEHHAPRSIRTFLKPDRMPAARRFAAGEISRAELMLELAA